MHVKETAVYIDDFSMSNKYEIGFPGETFLMERIPVPIAMDYRSDNKFGPGIAAPNTGHVVAALLGRQDVRHLSLIWKLNRAFRNSARVRRQG